MAQQRNLLKNMQLNSVDLCTRGCNPAADIKLMKSIEEGGENEMEQQKWTDTIVKAVREALGINDTPTISPEEEMANIAKAWQESSESIWNDTSLTAEERYEKLEKSREEMNDYIAEKTAEWAGVTTEEEIEKACDEEVNKEEEMAETAIEKAGSAELDFDMLSEEDQKTIADIVAKYTTKKADDKLEEEAEEMEKEEPVEEPKEEPSEEEIPEEPKQEEPEENPAVKKALDEMAELKKSIEMREMVELAKKYEPLGKHAEETAEMLYELKKSNESVYNDVIAVYDETLRMQESAGIFKEYGTNRTGFGSTELETTVTELKKSYPEKSRTELVELAYRTNPNLSEY